MKVKRYVADSIQEAITRVKNDLGRNAIILHTKPFKEGGFFGFFAKRRFEVIAAVDENMQDSVPVKKTETRMEPVTQPNNSQNVDTVNSPINQPLRSIASAPVAVVNPAPVLQPIPTISSNIPSESPTVPYDSSSMSIPTLNPAFIPTIASVKEDKPGSEPAFKSLHEEIAEVKELIRQVASKPLAATTTIENPTDKIRPNEFFRHYLELIGMEGEIIDCLITQMPSYLKDTEISENELIEYCRQLLTTRLMFSEPVQTTTSGEQQIMALIGPTGVGKTTTIAKLAANFNLFEGKRVGLITIDTYRIAAVEHLKTYGDIINLPVEVVYTPGDINQAIQNLRECNLILIDTAGRSPHNQVMMDELKKFLAHSKIGLILLVISATTKYQDMVGIAESFSRIAYTHLVFTKLDETESLGPVVSLAWKIRRPISYLTTGQNVPDDIEVAKPEKLIAQLLKKNH